MRPPAVRIARTNRPSWPAVTSNTVSRSAFIVARSTSVRLYATSSRRVLSVLASLGADAILEGTRALQPVSVEVGAVTLKEIFLETVTEEN